jgi:hypothetical protein
MVFLATFLYLSSSILGAAANPHQYGWIEEYSLARRDTNFPATISPSCVDFVIGADAASSGTPSGSQVCVTVDPGSHNVTVTYPSSPLGYLYDKEHVWVGCMAPTGKPADKSNAPGQYPFTSDNGYCTKAADNTTATCTFNVDTILKGCNSCDNSFYIITHASLYKKNADGTTTSVTGAGKGTSFGNAWHRMYWYPTFYCLCTSTITFTPSTFYYTISSTTTITSVSTTSYTTTSTSIFIVTTTSTSIYDTTEYSTTIFPSTSVTTSTSTSTPPTSYSTSTCHLP